MQKILEARGALVLESPFFGALALRLRLQEDPAHKTGWTDGKSIGYAPAFVETLTHSQTVGFLAHEVLHVASGHPWRRDGREAKRWNQACDYAINGLLVSSGFELPKDCLLSDEFIGHSAEWIYDRLPPASDDESGSNGEEPAGEVRDAPEDGPSEEETQQAVQQAANVAKARGELGGDLERFAKEAARAAIDWRSVLARFMQSVARSDYSWSRPNARHLARGHYLPALKTHAMGRIAVAVDTSGSVDDVLLAQFSAEINAIAREIQPEAIDVLYCDARINKRETYEAGESVELKACGGGGTDFCPVFDALEEESPACLVYLTDLCGSFPDTAPDYPVLWAATTRLVAPFGETVHMEG